MGVPMGAEACRSGRIVVDDIYTWGAKIMDYSYVVIGHRAPIGLDEVMSPAELSCYLPECAKERASLGLRETLPIEASSLGSDHIEEDAPARLIA